MYSILSIWHQIRCHLVLTYYSNDIYKSKYTTWVALIAPRKLKIAAATTTVTVLSTRSIMEPRNVERINCARKTILLTTATSVPSPLTWMVVWPSLSLTVDSLNWNASCMYYVKITQSFIFPISLPHKKRGKCLENNCLNVNFSYSSIKVLFSFFFLYIWFK